VTGYQEHRGEHERGVTLGRVRRPAGRESGGPLEAEAEDERCGQKEYEFEQRGYSRHGLYPEQ